MDAFLSPYLTQRAIRSKQAWPSNPILIATRQLEALLE